MDAKFSLKRERNYSTTDKELLACYFAVKKYEFYILGNEFVVYSNHQSLVHLKSFRDIVNKRFRWIAYLESMNVKILYIPGKENIISDYVENHKRKTPWLIIEAGVVNFELFSYSKNELIEKQMNDMEIKEVIEHLQNNYSTIPKSF